MDFEHRKPKQITDLPAIPRENVGGWEKKKIQGIKQELVPLGPFTDFSDCDTSTIFFGEKSIEVINFNGRMVTRQTSPLTHFVRRDVHDCLVRAQNLLPPGYFFKFYDGYRPPTVQQELFNAQRRIVAGQHPDWSGEKIDEETHKFIAKPAMDLVSRSTRPAPHTTGAAIDLRLIRLTKEGLARLEQLRDETQRGRPLCRASPEQRAGFTQIKARTHNQTLPENAKNQPALFQYGVRKALIFRNHSKIVDMGIGFELFDKEALTSYYETIPESELTREDKNRRQNRRLMFTVLKQAGLSNYPEEWWHWSYGDQEWAANLKKESALFGEVEPDEENEATEVARRIAYLHKNSLNKVSEWKGRFKL